MQRLIPNKYWTSKAQLSVSLLGTEVFIWLMCSSSIWLFALPERPSHFCLDRQIIVDILKTEEDGTFGKIVDVIEIKRDPSGLDIVHSDLYTGNKIAVGSIRIEQYDQLPVNPTISSRLKLYKMCGRHGRREPITETLFYEKPPRKEGYLSAGFWVCLYSMMWFFQFSVSVTFALMFNRSDRTQQQQNDQWDSAESGVVYKAS